MLASKKHNFSQVKLMVSIALLSLAIVSYQVQLIQFFNIVQWHHYAFMIISVAMLGFGASGTVISIFRNWLLKKFDLLVPLLMISTGLLMSFAVRLSRSDFFLFDSYTLFVDQVQFSKLLFTFFLFFIPFFFGALAIGLIFVKEIFRINKYYFSDLIGAGIGGVFTIFLFWKFSPQEIPTIIAFLPVIAGIIIFPVKNKILFSGYTVLTLAILIYHLLNPFDLSFSQFKGISYAMNLPEAKITIEKSSPYGLVQVVSSPVMRYAPGLSLTYHKAVQSGSFIYCNGDWFASIQSWSKNDSTHLLNYSTLSLPYAIGKRNNVLILNSHAGLEISHALYNKAEQVIAVEPNKSVISILKQNYSHITDSLFFHPKLQIYTQDSRSFLKTTTKKYDLIQLPLIGSFGGSIGLDALNEENLITKEAFNEMWYKLNSNGVIAISTWMDHPYKIPLRITTTIVESLESLGIEDPKNHLVLIRSWNAMTFVVTKNLLNKIEIKNVLDFCEKNEFDITLAPGINLAEISKNHMLDNEIFFDILEGLIDDNQRERIIENYDFNIKPATDNKPYFFQFLRWKKFDKLVKNMGLKTVSFLELGYLILIVTFILILLLALFFIVIPLFNLGWKKGHNTWVVLYFSGLGFGYMFLEIVFIKYFVLYLAQPIYSVATVISVMLISSGLGSYYSSKFKIDRKTLMKITGIIASIILIYSIFMGNILSSTVGVHISFKILITCILIALPSFFMGMPFPLGLKLLNIIDENNVPWAWGINGCITVISTSLAVIIAVELGFMAVMILSAMTYLLAFLSNILLSK